MLSDILKETVDKVVKLQNNRPGSVKGGGTEKRERSEESEEGEKGVGKRCSIASSVKRR